MDLDEPFQDPFDFDLQNFDLGALEHIDFFPQNITTTTENSPISYGNPYPENLENTIM